MAHEAHIGEEELLVFYFGESLQSAEIRTHLAVCPCCAREYERLKGELEALKEFLPRGTAGPQFFEKQREAILSRARERRRTSGAIFAAALLALAVVFSQTPRGPAEERGDDLLLKEVDYLITAPERRASDLIATVAGRGAWRIAVSESGGETDETF